MFETYNACEELLGHNLRARPDKLAFIDRTRTLSYGALADRVYRVGKLLADCGLRPEDRVAMLVLDTVDFPSIFLGAIRAGIVPVALNTLLSSDQYRYILGDCRARALVVSEPLLPLVEGLRSELPNLETVFVVGSEGAPAGLIDFEAQLGRFEASPEPIRTCRDDVAFWLYSSGSTGMPKGVQHTHGSLLSTYETYGREVLGIREDDVVFSAAKLFFAYGLGNGLSFPMAAGATTLLFDGRPTPEAVFSMFAERAPTLFFGVPTLYAALLAQGAGSGDGKRSSRLRLCVSAGEALPRDIGERWRQIHGVDIIDGVGSTEMLHIFLSNRPGDVVYGTSGIPVPGYEVKLMDGERELGGTEEVGEMWVRGESAAVGYWGQRAKSRQTFIGEWTRTGDKYVRDGSGRFIYQGRTDDMFKVSGIWVSPFEVESALIEHPSVLEAAVVPYEDEDGLTKPRAFVVTARKAAPEDRLLEELKAHVKDRIGKWKYPRDVVFMDSLPKTATGKVQRFKLRLG